MQVNELAVLAFFWLGPFQVLCPPPAVGFTRCAVIIGLTTTKLSIWVVVGVIGQPLIWSIMSYPGGIAQLVRLV